MAKPWLTSNDLITSVQRKIAVPLSQVTFTRNDILAFANEEMMVSQVPSVLQYHEEYFVHSVNIPMVSGVSRYAIPNRAVGMRLRDLKWADNAGNMFDMTRIQPEDKAFFQANIGANTAIHKFYVEGNDVVLSPSVVTSPTGSLVMSFYLRPNQLVKDDRAAIMVGFNQTILVNNSLVVPLDTVTINNVILTAVNTLGGSITAITPNNDTTTITSVGHQLSSGQLVTIVSSDSNPIVDGTFVVSVIDDDNFSINKPISVAGTTGTFTSPNQFQIGLTDTATAGSLSTAINATKAVISSIAPSSTVTLLFKYIDTDVETNNQFGFLIPQDTIGIQFNQLPSQYMDLEESTTTPLFEDGSLIDILQTEPGHRTYLYDVVIPDGGISGDSIIFPKSSLMVPTGNIQSIGNVNSVTTMQYVYANLQVGDYICLSNECIIPQIPPDLHSGLAERTSGRILAAQGDAVGLQATQGKIAEINQSQGTILDDRVEGTPQKVTARHSLLRYGKMGTRRRT